MEVEVRPVLSVAAGVVDLIGGGGLLGGGVRFRSQRIGGSLRVEHDLLWHRTIFVLQCATRSA